MSGEQNPLIPILTGEEPLVSWLLPDLIPRGSLIALAGVPGVGKSFFMYTLALGLATGQRVVGFDPPHPCRVLYFDNENGRPDRDQYLRDIWKGLGRPSLELIKRNLWCEHFVLGSRHWIDVAAAHIEQRTPDLIVLDTTTPCCEIRDENDNAEASAVITRIRALQTLVKPTAACVAIKHAKVDRVSGQYTLRGAKAWEGSVDCIIYHVRNQGRSSPGLAPTRLESGKHRAFGLDSTYYITPHRTPDGIVLAGSWSKGRPKT